MTKRRSWRVKSGAGRRRECAKCSVSHYSHGLTMRSVQTRTAQRQSVMQKSNCSAFDTSMRDVSERVATAAGLLILFAAAIEIRIFP